MQEVKKAMDLNFSESSSEFSVDFRCASALLN